MGCIRLLERPFLVPMHGVHDLKILPQSRRLQICANQTIPYVPEVRTCLVNIRSGRSLNFGIPHFGQELDVTLDFLRILLIRVDFEAVAMSLKLSRDDCHRHLTLIRNMKSRNLSSIARIFQAGSEFIMWLDSAIFGLKIQ